MVGLRGRFRAKARSQGSSALAIASYSVAAVASQNQAYAGATFAITGGSQPYTVGLAPGSAALPAGLTASMSTPTVAVITGTPTAVATTTGLVLRITDAAGAHVDTVSLSIDVQALTPYILATTAAELVAKFDEAVAAGGGKTIRCADGLAAYGSTIISLTNRHPTAEIVIAGLTNRGATLPGFDLTGSSKITLRQLKLHRLRVVSGTSGDPTGAIVNADSTTDVWVDDCELWADPMATNDFTGYFAASLITGTFQDGEQVATNATPTEGSGYYRANRPASSLNTVAHTGNFAITDAAGLGNGAGGVWSSLWTNKTMRGLTSGATCKVGAITSNINWLNGVSGPSATRLKVTANYIHDVRWCVSASGVSMTLTGNTWKDFYTSPFDIQGEPTGLRLRGNGAIGGWCLDTDGQPSGTNGPHSSTGGFSFDDHMPTDIDIIGNRLLIGRVRYDATGRQASASGVKINDMEVGITGSISGNVLTISAFTGALAASWTMRLGHRVIGPGVVEGAKVLSFGTGSGGLGTYNLSTSQTVAGGTAMFVQSRASGRMLANITDSNISQGTEVEFLDQFEMGWNLNVSTRDTRLLPDFGGPFSPSIYYGNDDPLTKIHHNMAMNTALNTLNRYTAADFLANSHENVISPLGAVAGNVNAFEALFDGIGGATPFSGATLENVAAMFAPKAGGRLAVGGIGPHAVYNFTTDVLTLPVGGGAAARPTVATAANYPEVSFNGSQYARYTAQGAEVMADLTDPNALTILMAVRMLTADNIAATLLQAANSDISITRLTSAGNRVRVSLKDATGAVCVQYDTKFGLTVADGLTFLVFSFDLANFRLTAMKNGIQDGFVAPSIWTGAPMRLTAKTLTVMGNLSGANLIYGGLTHLLVLNEFIGPATDQALMTRLVSQDGKPLDYGADGHVLTGTVPKIVAKGLASAWNAGINDGSAVRDMVPNSGLVDA